MAPTATLHTENIAINTYHDLPPKSVSMEGVVAKQMIFNIMGSRVAAIDLDSCRGGDDDAFIVADMGDVYRKHMDWKTHLGRVKPHYGK